MLYLALYETWLPGEKLKFLVPGAFLNFLHSFAHQIYKIRQFRKFELNKERLYCLEVTPFLFFLSLDKATSYFL